MLECLLMQEWNINMRFIRHESGPLCSPAPGQERRIQEAENMKLYNQTENELILRAIEERDVEENEEMKAWEASLILKQWWENKYSMIETRW